MGLNSIQIYLENSSGVFFAGQDVIGNVVVDVKPDGLKARGIRIKIEGEAKVHWTERVTRGSGDNRHTETVHYRNEEKYFELSQLVFGNGRDSDVLPGGQHSFGFNFRLPNSIPSSFEGAKGWVRYFIKVKVDRPWAFDSTDKLFFTVNSVVDLNTVPGAGDPRSDHKSKNFCCLCCNLGPMSAVVTLNQGGFAPGEKMRITAEVDNKSDVHINGILAKLKQRVTFFARGKRKQYTYNLARLTSGSGVAPGDTFLWRGEPMSIPPLPPSELKYCSIIDVDYWLEVTVTPSGAHLSMDLKMPLLIGTVPLRERFRFLALSPATMQLQPQPGAGGFAAPTAPPPLVPYDVAAGPPPPTYGGAAPPPTYGGGYAPTAPPPFFQQYPDLPPPSYQEVVQGDGDDGEGHRTDMRGDDDDDKGTNANWNYRPKYLTWTSRDESSQK